MHAYPVFLGSIQDHANFIQMPMHATLHSEYNPYLVLLSVIIAVFSSYVAFDLIDSLRLAARKYKPFWVVAGAVAMGFGIWSMHFTGMIAFEMNEMPMSYDLWLMVLSIFIAVGASAMALIIITQPVVTRSALVTGGIFMALAIAGMHYAGMYSMIMPAHLHWDVGLVFLSVVIALVASFGALMAALRLRKSEDPFRLQTLASVLMGIGIAGMHYVGMEAATFHHVNAETLPPEGVVIPSEGLALAVVIGTLLILSLALLSTITDRALKRSRKQRDESEQRFKILVDSIKDYAIYQLDPSGNISTWNRGAEALKGYSRQEVIGKHFSCFYLPEDVASGKWQRALAQAQEFGNFADEGWRVRKDGSRIWVNVVLTALRSDNGELLGFAKVTRDMTERKIIEQELLNTHAILEKRVQERTAELHESLIREKAAKEEAQAATEAKMQFLANMSHEIRTPMNAILGFSGLLVQGQMSREQSDYLARIKSNGAQLLRLIDDILDLSKFELGHIPVELSECDLRILVQDVVTSLKPITTKKGLELQTVLKTPVPRVILSDPIRLRQVFVNLLGNAVKFSDQGLIQIRIGLHPHAEFANRSVLEIEVVDNGIGISPEDQKKLFQPFSQADSSIVRKFGGTGLGLVLSRHIAKALGGNLILKSSNPQEGSCFALRLELENAHCHDLIRNFSDDENLVDHPAAEQAPTPMSLRQMRLLLAEDSPDNEALIQIYLKSTGVQIDVAHNGLEALEMASQRPYDLILMDIQMPNLDGLQATRQLRAKGFTKPIIALTAHALREEVEHSLEAGCNLHLTKPISRSELIQAIRLYAPIPAGVSAPELP